MRKFLAIVIGVLWTSLASAASLMPQGKQAYFDAAGDPLAGGKVYTYAAGTSTPLATYSDRAGTAPNANPVVLDARGEATIFWGAGPYKVSLYTSADVLVWTQDNMYPPFTAGDALGAALKLYSGGSAAEPELTWGDDTNSGLYLIGPDNVGLSIGGTKRWDFGTAGSTLTGTFDVTGATSIGSTLYVTGASTFSGSVTVPTPSAATNAATKAYVDDSVSAILTTSVSFATGWSGAATATKIGKLVTLELINPSNSGSGSWLVGTIPAAYRPSIDRYVPGIIKSGVTWYSAVFVVYANGNVTGYYYDNGTSLVAMPALSGSDFAMLQTTYTVP